MRTAGCWPWVRVGSSAADLGGGRGNFGGNLRSGPTVFFLVPVCGFKGELPSGLGRRGRGDAMNGWTVQQCPILVGPQWF